MTDDTDRSRGGRRTDDGGIAPTDDDTIDQVDDAESVRRDEDRALPRVHGEPSRPVAATKTGILADGGEIRIRRARATDADELVALHRRALREAGTDPDDVPGTADLRWTAEAYVETGGEFLLAAVDEPSTSDGGNDRNGTADRIVAMGGLVVDGPVGELYRFAVDPDHQRRGYGSALLGALETAARDRGVTRIRLTTASRQAAAVSFYRSRGYAETGRERHGEYELVRFEKSLKA